MSESQTKAGNQECFEKLGKLKNLKILENLKILKNFHFHYFRSFTTFTRGNFGIAEGLRQVMPVCEFLVIESKLD